MKNNKLKVLWFCYFSNYEVQEILKPFKRVAEIAPWINDMIPLFENNDQVELHILSQHEWISGYQHFLKDGAFYHFINKGMPFIGRHWPGFFRFDQWSNFYHLKKNAARLVNKINPDIIHLHGAENEFCTAITQFQGKYPIFITIQGYIHKTTIPHTKAIQKRSQKELEIIKTFKHFGYRTETMGKEPKALNPNAVLHWHSYPMKPIYPHEAEKQYDIVFFARMSKDKGIEDLLEAIAIIKKEKPDISLCAIGGGKTEALKRLADELGIDRNVFWAGFLPTQDDVHKMASAAKVSVLPTYHDIEPGTIVESMFLNLPVISSDIGFVLEINREQEVISVARKGDVKGLADTIIFLLNNDKLREEKGQMGRDRAMEMFNAGHDEIRQDILNAYHAVIEDFIGS